MINNLKILVISDLHAIVDERYSDDSRLEFKFGNCEYAEGFLSFVKRLDYKIDILICSGDISNKADKDSFNQGWSLINRIKEELKIPELLCVPGNHDHVSRGDDPRSFDPKHHMQYLKPTFPVDNFQKNTHFWAWNWCHIEGSTTNSILINSSAYHGHKDEHKHGRISTETISRIKEFILSENFLEKPINILVCHHHPYKMEHQENDFDTESMEGGDSLVSVLTESNKGPWLVVHGHRHIPQLRYAPSCSTVKPVVFSAGSFSAKLFPALLDKTKNQFYFIDVNLEKTTQSGNAIGRFETYEWTLSNGWKLSSSKYLPGRGGFGNTKSPKEIATKIQAKMNLAGDKFLNQNDLSDFTEDIIYFTPLDLDHLNSELEKLNLIAIFENYDLVQVGQKNV